MTKLPTDAAARKQVPIYSGFVKYFPLAMAEVAALSRIGNDQHNPGKPLHWDRSKSGDELDAAMRHLVEAGSFDTDNVRHSAKLAWRAMANLEKELEGAEKPAPDDGWIPYNGLGIPVSTNTMVEARGRYARPPAMRAGSFDWKGVVAYRVVE